uniref:Probable RNA 2'-phosphotransferase n=1 Tax=Pyrococcus horikoshii (strain ATCC 700860 / DSM 12428 / JCM 9974 / NBRC 100139 / OT-3) TaxID=70601 RepID=UPI0029677BC3|nr:Chain A, Probable RNA 2'-phosphotransferase [Pyrococcus horikoshii OT3]8TFX_A Chain A, Probable RNA 2'-phosphotransferase [Pyrococcus horikoshii OT3]8TFY_A Chain A, Probable RNA 2'-phosphotransferase [Pyrococcus horikoshii OT3]
SRFKVSKLMAYILRHSPWEFGLEPDEEGFVSIEELVNAVRKVYPWVTEEYIREIVERDEKGRYEIRGNKIRARYGHSYPVILRHEEDKESKVLYHGTVRRNLKGIMREGIKPMKRQYVHLSINYEDAYNTGMRHGEDVVVLIIDAECLRNKGYKILKAGKKVRIVKHVPVDCISGIL